jgi:hypothetical protein
VSTGRVYVSRDVVFDENVFPFAELHPNAGRRLREEILLLPHDNTPLASTDRGVHTNDHYLHIVPPDSSSQVVAAETPINSDSQSASSSEENAENSTSNDVISHAEATSSAPADPEADPAANNSPMIADSPMINATEIRADSSGSSVPSAPAPPPVSGVQTRLQKGIKIRKIYRWHRTLCFSDNYR